MIKKCGMCGKTVYDSEGMAKRQARWISSKGKELRPYYSTMCRTWHLTSEIEVKKRFK